MWRSKQPKIDRQFRANNLEASGNNLTKLVHMMCREAGIKIWVEIFEGPAPLKFAGALTGAISDNFRHRSQISPERIKILTSGKRYYQLQSLPCSTKNIWRTLSTNNNVYEANLYTPKINNAHDFKQL